jgi:hypothetical protein
VVLWLDTLLLAEALAAFVLASMNCRSLLAYARCAHSAARRTGAAVLGLVCGALALEALAFSLASALSAHPSLHSAVLLAVRTALLASSVTLSLLILRARR